MFGFCSFKTRLSVSFLVCARLCLGSQCLASAPGPTHTSAPLPTLWTHCLRSLGGSASYAWEKGMSCVARRSHSEPGPRRFLRLVSGAKSLSLVKLFLSIKKLGCAENGHSVQTVFDPMTLCCLGLMLLLFHSSLSVHLLKIWASNYE